MLTAVDGRLAPLYWEDVNPALVKEIQRESRGYTLNVLKDRLWPRDTVETTPGRDQYLVLDAVAPKTPCHVPNPDVVSECGLSELPSSIHSNLGNQPRRLLCQDLCGGSGERRVCYPTEARILDEGRGAFGWGVGSPMQAKRANGLQEETRGERVVFCYT